MGTEDIHDNDDLAPGYLETKAGTLRGQVGSTRRETVAAFLDHKQRGEPFDVVIVDLTIPGGLGGKDTIRDLRSIDPGVKAIVASGYSNDPVMADYRSHGFCGRLAKPFRIGELGTVLHEVLNESERFRRAP